MKKLSTLLLASAAGALMAGTAHAQATDTITLAVTQNGTGNVNAEVNLVETAILAGQTGILEFTVTPGNAGGNPWGVNGLATAGFVEVNLSNAVFGNPVDETAVNDTGDGTCAAGAQPVNASASADTITFEISNIQNCDGTGLGGVLQVEIPFALESIADANFSVGVTTVNATLADETSYDTDNMTAGVQPLVETGPAFTLAYSPNNAGDTELDLGLDPAFSAFDDTPTLAAQVGEFDITPGFPDADLQGTAVGNPTDLSVDIYVQDTSGIMEFTITDVTGGEDTLTLARDGMTNAYRASISGAVDPGDWTASPVTVTLTGDASVSAQSFTPMAQVTADNATLSQTATSALAPLTRDGTTVAFDWVGLSSNAALNLFRFTGLAGTPRVLVSVSNTSDGSTVTPDQDISGSLNISNGEAQISGASIGELLGVSARRGDVSITVEADPVQIDRLLLTAGGITDTAGLD